MPGYILRARDNHFKCIPLTQKQLSKNKKNWCLCNFFHSGNNLTCCHITNQHNRFHLLHLCNKCGGSFSFYFYFLQLLIFLNFHSLKIAGLMITNPSFSERCNYLRWIYEGLAVNGMTHLRQHSPFLEQNHRAGAFSRSSVLPACSFISKTWLRLLVVFF